MPLSEADAKQLLAQPKIARGPLTWVPKTHKETGRWLEARAAVSFAEAPDVVLEGFMVILQFRKSALPKADVITFGLFVGGDRICAVDIQPDDDHKNIKGGKGKPLYGQWVGGIHAHEWSDDGYGYVEPCAITGVEEYKKAWTLFQEKANITLAGDVNWPIELLMPELLQ